MSDLLKINVNDHTERKNGLTYLSWAWAWAEVLKVDPQATWEASEFDGFPASFAPDGSALVKVAVTIKGHTKTCWLPVMNHKNQAIKNPDAFAINTAIVRCLTKCISMHGLGLYIYAGEDLPEEEQHAQQQAASAEGQAIVEIATHMIDCHTSGNDIQAFRVWYEPQTWAAFDDKQEAMKTVWGHLREYSKLRSAIKANAPAKEAA